MKLKWHGHSCFEITLNNGTTIITDPFDETVGYPVCHEKADIAVSSHDHFDHNYFQGLSGSPRRINAPGNYNFPGIKITGVSSYHDSKKGALRGENTIFIFEADGMRVAHLGDLGHMPETDAQKTALKDIDLMLLPIGGTFTITSEQAAELVRTYAPKAAIAMHYRNEYCHFNITDCSTFVQLTQAKRLPNEVEVMPGRLCGCYIMEI